MSSRIYTDYGKNEMNRTRAGARTAGQQTQAAISFLGLAAQAGAGRQSLQGLCPMAYGTDAPVSKVPVQAALSSVEAYRSAMVTSASGLRTEEAAPARPATLEEMLKAKYPGIKYHVFDAGSSYWRTRNDYPHYLLYQDQIDTDAIENWKPSGPNPPYTPFQASKEIHALGAVPPGSKAVVIHPKVQARMDQDPEYAQEILTRIETWFTFDSVRNEAILPGCSIGMSQAVAIGEDGCIVNAVSSSQPRLTRSSSDTEDWWDIRKARHAYYMSLITETQLEHRLLMAGLSAGSNQSFSGAGGLMPSFSGAGSLLADPDGADSLLGGTGSLLGSTGSLLGGTGSLLNGLGTYQSSQAAKEQLAEMMKGSRLRDIFGPTLGGVSTDFVLEHTRKLVWGG